MSCRTYIISIADVRCVTSISDLVDDKKLKAGLDLAHMEARERLGTARYDALITAIDADNTLAGTANEKWRDLIAPGKGEMKNYLGWLTYYRSILRMHSAADKVGFLAKSGDGYTSIDNRTLQLHVGEAQDNYQLYERAMLKWIEDNEDTNGLPEVEEDTESDTPQFPGGVIMVDSQYRNQQDEQGDYSYTIYE